MTILEMPLWLVIVSFVVTWTLGLSPALVARYVVYKKPLARRKANWIAGIGSFLFWVIFLFINGETRPGNGVVWVLVFFVSRWLMTRDSDKRRRGATSRADMLAKLQEKIDDPNTSPEQRQWAADRLSKLKQRQK